MGLALKLLSSRSAKEGGGAPEASPENPGTAPQVGTPEAVLCQRESKGLLSLHLLVTGSGVSPIACLLSSPRPAQWLADGL